MMVKENQLKERVKQQPPQQAAPQTQSAPKKAAGKKSRGKLVLGGVLFLFAAAALTLGVLALTANLFGGRDAAINYLISMDPEYLTAAEIRADLELREADD